MTSFETFRRLGLAYSLVLIGAVVGWIALGAFLSIKSGWPDDYGYHCHGRGCLISDLRHSPALLRRGGFYADAMFAYIWSLLPAIIVFSLWIGRRIMRRDVSRAD